MATEDFTLKINTEFDPGASARESEKLANSFDMIGKEAAEAASGTDDLTDSLGDKLSGAARESMKAIEGLEQSTEDANEAVLVSAEGINAWAVNLSNFINIGAAAIGAIRGIAGALTGFIEGLETAGNELGVLQSSLNNIQASTSASADAMDNFTNFLGELSAQSSVSEAELAKVAARFTAVGLSQRDAGEGAIAVLNLVRMTGREVEEVTQAVVDSVKGSAEGLSVLGVNVSDLTVQELLRGDAVDRLNDLYGRSLVPLERTDEFIGEIRRKWDLIRKTLFQSIGSSETIRSIFEIVSKALSEVIESLPDIGTFIDLAFKEAVARVLEFRAGILDAIADVETLITRFSIAGSVLGGIQAAARGNVVGVAVAGAAAGFGARARVEGREGRDQARSKAEELRTLAEGVRDGTTNIFDELKKVFPFLANENGKSLKSLLDLLDESKTGSTIARDTNNSLAAQGVAAREAIRVTQAFRDENKASLDALREAIIDGNLEISSPELELMNDVVASLNSGNEVRVRDLEALQALAESVGIANASEIQSASELLGLLSGFRSNIESEISGLQANFDEQASLYEEQREELIENRKQAADQHAARIGTLNKQLAIMETATKRDEAGIQLLREQIATIQEGFAMDAQAVDVQIAALDAEFTELKNEARDIANREVQNVRDVADRAARQRNRQIAVTDSVRQAVNRSGAKRAAAIRASKANAKMVSDAVKTTGAATKDSVDKSSSNFDANVNALREEQRKTSEAINARVQSQNAVKEQQQQERREEQRRREEQAFIAAENEKIREHESAEAEKTRKNAEKIARQQRRSQVAIAKINASAKSAPAPSIGGGGGGETFDPAQILSSTRAELANLERANQQFIERAVQEQINRREQQEKIDEQNERDRARREREFELRQTELMRETRLLEESLIADRNEQQVRAQTAFNPFRDPDAAEREQIPLNIQIQLGDQKLADILTNLQESSLGQVLEVPR